MSMDLYIYHNLQLIDRIENHNYEEATFEWVESSDSSDDEEDQAISDVAVNDVVQDVRPRAPTRRIDL